MENVLAKTEQNEEFNLYKDIQIRTGGEIYIGVVGPVRTGKSTFIKRFMDLMVLPFMEEGAEKVRLQDELPQSASGKTITTTEPKFIPKNAASIKLNGELNVKVRLVDCVGYMADGAAGHMEDDTERMVKTPWYDYDIPFTQAAEIGTQKVINDHSTIGIVVTTDGSIGELSREAYEVPEEKAILELKKIKKPFIVLVNSSKPYSDEAKMVAKKIGDKFQVSTMCMNCEQMKKDDINKIMENVLYEFPINMIEFYMPKWVDMISIDHPLKQSLIQMIKDLTQGVSNIKDLAKTPIVFDNEYCKRCIIENIDLSDGTIRMLIDVDDKYYYEMLSNMIGSNIDSEYQLLAMLKELAEMKKEYTKVLHAMEAVRMKGYGVVTPERTEIILDTPQVIKHGNKYGVKIKAQSPSIHMIKANVVTEIAPIVGSEQQAKDLIHYISDSDENENGIWDTNIFGKTVEQLVNDGIASKIAMIGDESQAKLQETMQKIVNESNGGLICIII